MSLARAWTRQLFGASGAALLGPGPVGLATQTLESVGRAVDRVLPLRPPSSHSAGTSYGLLGLFRR